jgi:hypothetical protein
VTVVRAPMHFSAGDYIDPGNLLIEDRRLARAELGVRHRSHRKLPNGNEPIQRLEPVRDAVGADDGGGIFWIERHLNHAMLTDMQPPKRTNMLEQHRKSKQPQATAGCGKAPLLL